MNLQKVLDSMLIRPSATGSSHAIGAPHITTRVCFGRERPRKLRSIPEGKYNLGPWTIQ